VLTAILAGMTWGLGCHAQVPATPAAAHALTPDVRRRVEVLIRSKLSIPPDYAVDIGPPTASDIPNYNTIVVAVSTEGKKNGTATFLLSTDGKTLAQFNKFDLSRDPKDMVSGAGRPARGGGENAPVLIVGFDDLECPYCAKMNAQLFPALLDRYKNQVRIVYLDFPLSQHPWAMRAAVDVNCLGAQSAAGYWEMVDYVHKHAAEIGSVPAIDKSPAKPDAAKDNADATLARADDELDKLTRDEGKRNKVKEEALNICMAKQDHTAIDATLKLGETLGVQATPVLFINGEKLEGAYPIENVFRMVDEALTGAGQTPPPPFKPATVTDDSKPAPPTPKPGS
jgi:protein-disulfide isomerase